MKKKEVHSLPPKSVSASFVNPSVHPSVKFSWEHMDGHGYL